MLTGTVKFKKWIRIVAMTLCMALIFTSFPPLAYAAVSVEDESVEDEADINENEELEEDVTLEKNFSKESIVSEESTEDVTIFDCGGGKNVAIFHSQNVRFENEDGKLTEYDPELVSIEGSKSEGGKRLSGYELENSQGDKKQYLPLVLSEDTPLLMENGEYSIEMAPIDNADLGEVETEKEPVATIYESVEDKEVKAVYESTDETISYEYTSLADGIKETIVLNERPESNVFTYKLTLKNMTAHLLEDENIIVLKDEKTEKDVAIIDKPFMNDKSGEAYSEDITYTLTEKTDGEYEISLTASREYLDDEERLYPVEIDPTATWKDNEKFVDTYVINGSTYANTNFYSEDAKVMPVGDATKGTYRTYVKIPYLKTTLEDKYIDSAYLTVYETANSKANQKVRINRIIESWSVSTITWNSRPDLHTNDYVFQFTTTGEKYAAHNIKMTNTVRSYINETNNLNYGIAFRNFSDTPEYAEFYGSRATSTSYRPKLVVTYYDKPTSVTSITTSRKETDDTYTNSIYMKEGERMYVGWDGIESHNLADVQFKIIAADENTPEPTSVSSSGIDLTQYRSLEVAASDATNVKVPYSIYLPEGKYRIYIRGKDAGGMYGGGKYKIFYVDGDAPTLTGVSVSPATTSTSLTNDRTPTLTWTATMQTFQR